MRLLRLLIISLLLAASVSSARAVELQGIDRTIDKEPQYENEPVYALLVFGPEAETRIWLVLDGDTLYVDGNGNGDLTEPAERVKLDQEKTDEINVASGSPYKGMNVFPLGNLGGLETEHGKTRLRLDHWVRKKNFTPKTDFYKRILARRDKYGWENATLWRYVDEDTTAQNPVIFSPRPEDAQISHLGGPLTVQLKWGDRAKLKRGENPGQLSIHIGTQGLAARNSRREVFSPLTCDEVPPEVQPVAEIRFPAETPDAPPIRRRVGLKERC